MTVLNNLLSFFSSSARNSFSERVVTRSFLRVSFNALDTVSKRFDSRLKFSSILSVERLSQTRYDRRIPPRQSIFRERGCRTFVSNSLRSTYPSSKIHLPQLRLYNADLKFVMFDVSRLDIPSPANANEVVEY